MSRWADEGQQNGQGRLGSAATHVPSAHALQRIQLGTLHMQLQQLLQEVFLKGWGKEPAFHLCWDEAGGSGGEMPTQAPKCLLHFQHELFLPAINKLSTPCSMPRRE